MKLLPKLLGDEDELDRRPPDADGESLRPAEERPAGPRRRWLILVAIAALIPRLTYLFGFNDPENAGHGFTDAYHHWQIAYLTKEIGLSHGPRLWDLRGLEYYWGLLHPLLMNLLFFATGSIDIVLARLLSLAFGTLAVVLIFMLCHRYWGMPVAVAASAFAAVSPASVFNDDAGMVEPIAIALLLLGIWLTPKRGFWAGAAWGFAAMARVEAWLFGAGLVVAWVLGRRSAAHRLPLLAGWVLVMVLYMKFLLDQTGNAIYPLYFVIGGGAGVLRSNFQVVALGSTTASTALTASQELLRIPLGALAIVSAAGLAWSLWERPASYLLLAYGFGYSAFQAATFGSTQYLLNSSAWMERRIEFPLDFAAILGAVILVKVLPTWQPHFRSTGWVAATLALLAIQFYWSPIQNAYAVTEDGFHDQVRLGQAIGEVYKRPEYKGGVIGVPYDMPTLVYTMARFGGVPGDRLTSEFYDPFYYLPSGYHYNDHKQVAGVLLQCWLTKTHIRLLLVPPTSPSVQDYLAFIGDNPDWFNQTGAQLGDGFVIVAVHVPVPNEGDCAQAARSAAA